MLRMQMAINGMVVEMRMALRKLNANGDEVTDGQRANAANRDQLSSIMIDEAAECGMERNAS
jgi:putative cell wall-binding protein